MDADEMNGSAPNSQHGSTQPNNMQITVTRSHSDIESLHPVEISADATHRSTPHWVSILDNPSLRMGRMITLGAAAIYGTNFATVKLLDDTMPLSISVSTNVECCVLNTMSLGNVGINLIGSLSGCSQIWSGICRGFGLCVGQGE